MDMDNKNFSTSYIPLEKPYQIIKYGKDIGMQIGTLVASCMEDGGEGQPFRIESHSYPVVAYADKMSTTTDKTFFALQPMEGVVWNRVELSDVITICLTGEHLTWQEFINFLWTDIQRTGYTAAPQYDTSVALRNLGASISAPPKGKHVVHLHYGQNKVTKEKRVSSLTKDIMAINIPWDEDIQKMKNRVLWQMIMFRLSSVGESMEFPGNNRFSLSFETDNEELASLVKTLNTLKRDDWDISSLTKTVFEDMSLNEKLEVLNKVAFDKAKGLI